MATDKLYNALQRWNPLVFKKTFLNITGPKWVPDGEGHIEATHLAHIYSTAVSLGFLNEFSVAKRQQLIETLNGPTGQMLMEKAKDKFIKYIEVDEHYRLLVKTHHMTDHSLHDCTEEDIYRILKEYLNDSVKQKVARKDRISKDTFASYCSELRKLFFKIGRFHAPKNHLQATPIPIPCAPKGGFYTYNPVSWTLEKEMKETINTKVRKAYVGDDDLPAREGRPLSVALAVFIIMSLFEGLVTTVMKYSADIGQMSNFVKKKMINRCQMILVKIMLLHEGGRPYNELFRIQCHTDFNLLLHEKVPWLTLVFLDYKTLLYLLKNSDSLLNHYECTFHKGKNQGQPARPHPRVKSVVTAAYNFLDMLWMYIICMKILFYLEPELLQHKIFLAQTVHLPNGEKIDEMKNPCQINKNLMEPMKIEGATHYAFRYGAAIEDVILGIEKWWTRYRMGHSVQSMIHEIVYANHGNKRAMLENAYTFLGTDLSVQQRNNLECNARAPLRFQKGWLDKAFGDNEEMRQDFVKTSATVNDYLYAKSTEARSALIDKLGGRLNIQGLPIGLDFKFAAHLLPSSLVDKYNGFKSALTKVFDMTSSDTVFELQYFVDVVYNNWGKPYNTSTGKFAQYNPTTQPAEVESDSDSDVDSDDEMLMSDDEREKITKKRKAFDSESDSEGVPVQPAPKPAKLVNKSVTKPVKELALVNKRARKVPDKIPAPAVKKKAAKSERIYELRDGTTFKKGDIVVIAISEGGEDKYAFKVPSAKRFVWLAIVDSYNPKTQEFKGRFAEGKKTDLDKLNGLAWDKKAASLSNIIYLCHVFDNQLVIELSPDIIQRIRERVEIALAN